MKKPAVFIDRDGTLSEEVGYVNHPTRFKLFPYASEALRLLKENGFMVILVTNQSGVAQGMYPESMVNEIHEVLQKSLAKNGAQFDAIYYCAHHPTLGIPPYRIDCSCRKPKTGLIDQACEQFEIDLANSWVIGDRFRDVQTGHNAGTRAAFVLTGYGRGEFEYQRAKWKRQPEFVCEDLLEAAKSIVQWQRKDGQGHER